MCRTHVCRIVPAGLVLLVCTKAPRAGLDTEAEQSLLLLMVPFFLASSNLLEQPGLWSGGAGRQREAAWEHQDAELASSLDTAIRLLEAGQACLQGTSCCCSQILSKFGCSVSLGPLLTVSLDQVAVLALCVQLVALHAAVVFPL